MNKPLVPEDVKRARPCVYLARAAASHLRAFNTGMTPVNAAKQMFGQDLVTDLILRAPTTPAAISGSSGWAQSLAGVASVSATGRGLTICICAALVQMIQPAGPAANSNNNVRGDMPFGEPFG